MAFTLFLPALFCTSQIKIPMKFRSRALHSRLNEEKKSAQLLMEKMGLDKRELEEISYQYGVSAAQLVDVMKYGKYQFIMTKNEPGRCQPCQQEAVKLNTAKP
jgi:hypothetical protein